MFLSEKEPKEIIASAHVSFGRRSSNHQDSKIKIFTRRWIITSVLFKVRRVCNIMGLVVPALTFNFNLHYIDPLQIDIVIFGWNHAMSPSLNLRVTHFLLPGGSIASLPSSLGVPIVCFPFSLMHFWNLNNAFQKQLQKHLSSSLLPSLLWNSESWPQTLVTPSPAQGVVAKPIFQISLSSPQIVFSTLPSMCWCGFAQQWWRSKYASAKIAPIWCVMNSQWCHLQICKFTFSCCITSHLNCHVQTSEAFSC